MEAGAVAAVVSAAIAAAASVYNAAKSRRLDRKTDTSNGHTLGELVEHLVLKLDRHIDDADAHHRNDTERR